MSGSFRQRRVEAIAPDRLVEKFRVERVRDGVGVGERRIAGVVALRYRVAVTDDPAGFFDRQNLRRSGKFKRAERDPRDSRQVHGDLVGPFRQIDRELEFRGADARGTPQVVTKHPVNVHVEVTELL